MDSGEWSGDTPLCDGAAVISEYGQSSTAQPDSTNDASRAIDGDRETCSKTLGETNGAEWTAILQDVAREIIRFMLYLPKGPVSYEVFFLRRDGSEVSCGRSKDAIVINDWTFHNCLQPNNTGAVAVKVKSLTDEPLEICEVMVHTLTDPTCVDPHFNVANGRLRLTRKTAYLVCNKGFTKNDKSSEKLDCIRTGVWSRRNLRCEKANFGVVDIEGVVPQGSGPVESKEPEVSGTEAGPLQPEVSGKGEGPSQSKEQEVEGNKESSLQPGEPEISGNGGRPLQQKEEGFSENGERPSQAKQPEASGNEGEKDKIKTGRDYAEAILKVLKSPIRVFQRP